MFSRIASAKTAVTSGVKRYLVKIEKERELVAVASA